MRNFDLSGVLQVPLGCRPADVGCALRFQKNLSLPGSLMGSSVQKEGPAIEGGGVHPGGNLQNTRYSN